MEYAIVDIETTGSHTSGNRITEIAIIIHDGIRVVEKFQTLINPGVLIPFHIQALTGISDDMVEDAPIFRQIAKQIYGLLDNRIFVAHNVNFDYSFLVHELKMVGIDWSASKLCTVRLSRKIIPNMASYSLGKLCQNLNIPIVDRHRALGDVEATVLLFEKLIKNDKDGIITNALKKTITHNLPEHLDENSITKLPETSGVYTFRDKSNNIIYVEKALNIKNRVLSHFSGNTSSAKKQTFINEIQHIDFEESGTELMALLMECQAITQHFPKYNRNLKKYEPKFSLISYEDQKGYIRLIVSPYDKQALAIQHFERATDANQQLLTLMQNFDLDNRLCFFYSVSGDMKPKFNHADFPDVIAHNYKIETAIEKLKSTQSTFLLIDQGRSLDEKSYVYFKQNQILAMGFVDSDHQATELEDFISTNDRCTSNYYMTSLVLQYAERFPSKIIVKKV